MERTLLNISEVFTDDEWSCKNIISVEILEIILTSSNISVFLENT